MADVNYSNPASFLPKNDFSANGPLGGVMWGQQVDDYREQMANQRFLQELARQEAFQKQQEFMQGVPLRGLQRQAQGETLQGQMPFLQQQAGAEAENKIAGAKQQTATEFGPEARGKFFEDIKQKATEDQWKNHQKELIAGAELTHNAIAIQKSQGQMAAQAYMQQGLTKLKDRGITLPQHFADPQLWEPINKAATDSIAHLQEMEKGKLHNTGTLDVAKEHTKATLGAASMKLQGEKLQNEAQAFNVLQSEVFSGDPDKATPEKIARYTAKVEEKWNGVVKGNPALQFLSIQSNDDTEQGKKSKAAFQAQKDNYMKSQGLKPSTPTPAPKPGGGKSIVEQAREFLK